MGKCVYCQDDAGFLHRAHQKCRENHNREMFSLMDAGRFRNAAMAAEKAVQLDPALAPPAHYLLSTIYFGAMSNAKVSEAEASDVRGEGRTIFHGMEEQVRSADPSVYKFLYGDPSEEELEAEDHRRECTLDALGCSYAYARDMAWRHTQAVLRDLKPASRHLREIKERINIIRMMDEMYGIKGDQHNPDF